MATQIKIEKIPPEPVKPKRKFTIEFDEEEAEFLFPLVNIITYGGIRPEKDRGPAYIFFNSIREALSKSEAQYRFYEDFFTHVARVKENV